LFVFLKIIKRFLSSRAKLRKMNISFIMYVRPSFRPSAWNYPAFNRRIFMKFYI